MTYEWKKTAWKGVQIFVFGGLGALVAYLTNLPVTETTVIAIAVFKMAQNFIKNAESS